MTENKECDHHVFVHSTMCKFCGRLQCDRCIKEHLAHHVVNNYKEIPPEDFE